MSEPSEPAGPASAPPPETRGMARRVASAFLYTGLGHGAGKTAHLVAIFVALKLVGTAEFGLASLTLAIIAILRSVTEMSLGVALVQARNTTREQIDSLFWFSLLISSAFYVLIFAAAPWVAAYYHRPPLASLLRVHSLGLLLFSLVFVPRTLIERDLQFGRLAAVDNGAVLLSAVVMVFLAQRGFGAWAFVGAELATRFMQALLYQTLRPYRPRLRFRFQEIRSLVSFGGYASGSRLLYNFYINADYLIIGRLFGDVALGLYTFAYRVVSDPAKELAAVVNQVAYPTFARLQQDRPLLRRYFFTIARVAMALIGSLLAVAVVFLEQALVLFGYQQYLPALPLVYVFAGMGLLQSVSPLIPQLLNAVGKPRVNFIYSVACATVMPTGFWIGARFGLTGVALAWISLYPVLVLCLFVSAARTLELPFLPALMRGFSGMAVVALTALGALAWRFGLQVLEWPLALSLPTGVGGSLLISAALLFLREREQLKALRSR